RHPTFTGSVDAGSIVTLYNNGVLVTSTTVSAGSYSITIPSGSTNDLPEGVNNIVVSASDVAGNIVYSPVLVVIVDATAPGAPSTPDLAAASDTGSSATDNLTGDATPTFIGTAEAGSTVQLFTVVGSNLTLIGSGPATDGVYSITTSQLAGGTHQIVAKSV